MSTHRDAHGYTVSSHAGGFFAGLLMGGLIGSGAMMLLAPRSGKETRTKMQEDGLELRGQVVDSVEGAVAHARVKAQRVAGRIHKQSKELQKRGQDILDDQIEVVSEVVEGEKTAVHNIAKG
jgi:gas vesicle protein